MNLDSQEPNQYLPPIYDNSYSHPLFESHPQLPYHPPRLGLISSSSSKSPEPTRDLHAPLSVPKGNNFVEFSSETGQVYHRVRRGKKNDTMELNINFKTILIAHLATLDALSELTPQQKSHILAFSLRSPSFSSITTFFRGEGFSCSLYKHLQEFFSSALCIRKIIEGRCHMKNKLQMIKFIEKLRVNFKGIRCKWKQSIPPQATIQ